LADLLLYWADPRIRTVEWRKMREWRPFAKWLVVLGVLHGTVVCAGFFAPYDAVEQDRQRPYLPPMRLHFLDAHGHLHVRPFVYSLRLRESSFDQYEEDTTEAASREVFPEWGWLPVVGIPAAAHALFRQREHAHLSSRYRCLWPRPAVETPLWWPGVAIRWAAGSGSYVIHRLVDRCGGGLLRRLER